MESSHINTAQEDVFYNTMMLELLRTVLAPVVGGRPDEDSDGGNKGWIKVREPSATSAASTATWKNMFEWKSFTKKKENRQKIVL